MFFRNSFLIVFFITVISISWQDTNKLSKKKPFTALVTAYFNENSNLEGGPFLAINPHKGNLQVQNGVVAVDPTYWPYGTIFYIKEVGIVVAADTGSWIKGKKHLDLAIIKNTLKESRKACTNWGRKKTIVYVLYQPAKAKNIKKTIAVQELRKVGIVNYINKRKIYLQREMKNLGIADEYYIGLFIKIGGKQISYN